MMRSPQGVALWTVHQLWNTQGMVATATIASPLGYSLFRQCAHMC
jgi:hypothetical protein